MATSPPSPPRRQDEAGLFEGHGLICLRGERVVFANLDFSLGRGEALLLVGPNGSGKSSLLRIMAGLLAPLAGSLTWDGIPVRDDREAHGARMRYIGHLDAVKPVLTVAENVAFWVRLWSPGKTDIDDVVDRALGRFDMARLRDMPGKLLSAGQRRRVNLARLLAAPAPVWLLDEPTTALDRASVAVLEDAIAEHRSQGGMVALSTHTDVALPDARTFAMDRFEPDMDALDIRWAEAEGEL